jgi:DNA repair exonuclease SbcCD ATPase subunit
VRVHRLADLAEAEARAGDAETKLGQAQRIAAQADRHLKDVANQAERARQARIAWEQAHRKRVDADDAFREAWRAVVTWEGRITEGGAALDELRVAGLSPDLPTPAQLRSAVEVLEINAAASRKAAEEAHRIRGKLERRTALDAMLGSLEDRAEAAEGRVATLREKVRGLGFDKDALQEAARVRDAADAGWRRASADSARSSLDAARERERANAAVQTLEAARAQHGALSDLEQRSLHVARVAELLSDFRNTVVASVGPRLAVQAAELFAELTDHEYERLEVDPDDYQVKIGDRGELFGLDRFSGSEVDLANLALRVAISEHIHFQSGGSVGLLVLDEVFGPLDEDRKGRMLLALERLRGRFRQVLVVTHDPEIKEQLPNAIEIVKLPARRATARVLGD